MHVDWFRVISDIERSGMTHREIARHLHAACSTIAYWKQGAEPRYSDGERLVRLWELVTHRHPSDLPYTQWGDARYRRK